MASPRVLIDEHGSAVGDELPATDVLVAGYRELVLARRLNDVAGALVRQGRHGRLPVHATARRPARWPRPCASPTATGCSPPTATPCARSSPAGWTPSR